MSKGSQTVRACQIHESEPGKLINAATSAPFSYKDDCVQLDPHVGGNAEAREAAYLAVTALLRERFQLSQ